VERFTRVDADAIAYQFTVGNGLIMEDMLRVARMPETP